jgi:hypothetical protein
MNSLSRTHCKDDCEPKSKHFNNCEPSRKFHKESEVLLKCGTPGSVTLPLATAAGTAFTLSTVTINTEDLCNPCIKFEFASNIVTTAALLTLNFQIFKLCRNQFTPIPVGPIWTFSRAVAITDANTFSFIVCECNNVCPDDCCTYSVVATVAGVATVGVTSINNATLSALVVENETHCC